MTVAFDENVQERDCVVLFKFNGEFDVCVTVIEVVENKGLYYRNTTQSSKQQLNENA